MSNLRAAAPATAARPDTRLASAGVAAGAVLFATALTGAASQVSVTLPGTVIPFTLQPVAVLLAGAVLGARLGAASQVMYLAAGIVGASMFAWSPVLLPGAARLLGPTGGFLMAYPAAAFVAGRLADRGRGGVFASFGAMLAGIGVIYLGGMSWAMATLPGATLATFLPFIALDVVKVLAAALAVPALRRVLGR